MTTRKKLIITTAIISVAVLLAITALVVVLVANNNRADSGVRVQFTATNVSIDLSARYLVGDTWNDMSATNGGKTLSLTPKNTSGTLSPLASTIKLDTDNYILVFEYKFTSRMSSVGTSISLNTIPTTQTNVKLHYCYSNIQLSNIDDIKLLASFDNYSNQALGYNTTRYVYIVAEIQDLLVGAKLEGDFAWAVNRADVVKITYNNIPATAVVSDNYEYVVKGTNYNNLYTYPFDINKMFLGWGTSSTATTPVAFPKTFSSATTYYPIYASGGYDLSSCYEYLEGDKEYKINFSGYIAGDIASTIVVLPDIYDDGIHGVAPVTQTNAVSFFDATGEYRYDSYVSVIRSAYKVYVGNNIRNINGLLYNSTQESWAGEIQYLYIGQGLNIIEKNSVDSSINATIPITNALNLRYAYVVPGNEVFDSRNNCNAIVETATNKIITGTENTTYPTTITTIGTQAFYAHGSDLLGSGSVEPNTMITVVNIPSNITKIEIGAFSNCKNLIFLTLNNGIQTIQNYAFRQCNGIQDLYVPSSVTSIGYCAFSFCSGLRSITVDSANTVYDSRNNCNAIIRTSDDTLLVGCQNSIPNTVKQIYDDAFYGHAELTSITIPNSVTYISYAAFGFCTGLTSVTIPNSVTKMHYGVFVGCSNLTSVIMSGTWYVSTDKNATSGTTVSVTNATTNAENIKNTYRSHHWFRSA